MTTDTAITVGAQYPKVEVMEVTETNYPHSEGLTFTIGCSRCGEQGNYLTRQEAEAKASRHRTEHQEQPY